MENDDNVTNLGKKGAKTPKEQAVGKMREQLVKEWDEKVKIQAGKAHNAARAAINEKRTLDELIIQGEAERVEFDKISALL